MTETSSETSSATVPTDRPARYGKQLVAHLGRRSGGEWSEADAAGWIALGDHRAEVTASEGALLLHIHAPAAELDRIEDVVGRHLVRFGTRDELVVRWLRADGTPGTEQRVTEE